MRATPTELPQTLCALRKSHFSEERLAHRGVKDELRDNLICKLQRGEALFPGIIGYEDSVIPQVVNSERYRLDLSPYPTISRIYENCMRLDAFIKAHPNNQPDRDD